MTGPIPKGYTTLTPMLVFKDVRKAIDFYYRAFDAQEHYVMTNPDGRGVLHAELRIGNSIIMFGEENPQASCSSAETLGASPVSFYLYCADVDSSFRTAVAAGATEQMAPTEMFWGDRIGTVRDPFGYSWTLATHVRDLTQEEIRQGAQAFFGTEVGR